MRGAARLVQTGFTGANERARGKVEAADKGTLFLDEIGELPLPMQAKLLQFLEAGSPIADVMTRVVFAVRADDPLFWAIRLMVEERVHRVMVTDDAGTLVGIVVPMDVLRAIVPSDAPAAHDVGFAYVDLRR